MPLKLDSGVGHEQEKWDIEKCFEMNVFTLAKVPSDDAAINKEIKMSPWTTSSHIRFRLTPAGSAPPVYRSKHE